MEDEDAALPSSSATSVGHQDNRMVQPGTGAYLCFPEGGNKTAELQVGATTNWSGWFGVTPINAQGLLLAGFLEPKASAFTPLSVPLGRWHVIQHDPCHVNICVFQAASLTAGTEVESLQGSLGLGMLPSPHNWLGAGRGSISPSEMLESWNMVSKA